MGRHTTTQHLKGKGFEHVIVGAGGEAIELVHVLDAGGQKYDGTAHVLAQAAANLKAVHARHVHIEQYDVERRFGRGGGKRLCAAMRSRDLVTLHAKILRKHIRDIDLVINDQHAAWRPSALPTARRSQVPGLRAA